MEHNKTVIKKSVKDNNRAVEESKTLNYGKEDSIKNRLLNTDYTKTKDTN